MSDVRLATFLGDPQDGIGYINLGGFNSGAGRDFRQAFLMLRYSAPDDLKGLVLDLRGNPGGLLDAAVEISSYLVPAKSEIVSSKSRSGPEVVYKSTIEPIRPVGTAVSNFIYRLA
jgi:carboxyl-terminal processing protease